MKSLALLETIGAGWLSTVEVIPVRESPAVMRISLSGCLYIGPFISASKEDVKTGIKGSPSSSALLMSATFSTKFICPLIKCFGCLGRLVVLDLEVFTSLGSGPKLVTGKATFGTPDQVSIWSFASLAIKLRLLKV